MTDARLPHRWLSDPTYDALSDRLWRVHTGGLMWSNEHGTDGAIPKRTLRLLHPDGATPEDAGALVQAGLWEAIAEGWQILEWGDSQSFAADVERGRELHRERQRRYRERGKRAAETPAATRNVTHHETRNMTRLSLRQGQARPGLAVGEALQASPGTAEARESRDRSRSRTSAPTPSGAPALPHVRSRSPWDDLTPERQADARDWLRLASRSPEPDLSEWRDVEDADDLAAQVDEARDWVRRFHVSQGNPVAANVLAALETTNVRDVLAQSGVPVAEPEWAGLADECRCWHWLVRGTALPALGLGVTLDALRDRIAGLRADAERAAPRLDPERIASLPCDDVRRTVAAWAASPV